MSRGDGENRADEWVRIGLIAAMLGLMLYMSRHWLWSFWPTTGYNPNAQLRQVEPRGPLNALESGVVELFERNAPSVVHIRTLSLPTGSPSGPEGVRGNPQTAGSGIVWDTDGHIVTNFHVVVGVAKGTENCDVVLRDGLQARGTLLGYDEENDIAVLHIKVAADRLSPIAVGTSADLKVGQSVYAIGNPFGLDRTLTAGIISALDREVPFTNWNSLHAAIQVDAAVNPGNSGGPLLDSAGRLIGVTTLLQRNAQNIGFGIPVDVVNKIVTDIIATGKVSRGPLGMRLASEKFTRSMGYPMGLLIADVLPGGPADIAGLQGLTRRNKLWSEIGDIVLAINEKPINAQSEYLAMLAKFKPPEVVKVRIARLNRQKNIFELADIDVTLQNESTSK